MFASIFEKHRIDFVAQNAGRFSNTRLNPPEEWMPAIIELMKNYQKQGAIRSKNALMVTLCEGDAVAALMLDHILSWHQWSIRSDGAIWRSAEEWLQQTGLTRSQVYNEKRRARLKAAGLKVWVERAFGENTMHFKIEATRLTANIAKLLGLDFHIVQVKLWQIVPVEVPQLRPIVPFPQPRVSNEVPRVSNGEIPLTKQTTKPSTNKTTLVGGLQNDFSGNESFALLNHEKLSAAEKSKYAVLPASKVQECIDDTNAAKAKGSLKKNRLAYLRGCLANALKDCASPTTSPSAETAPLSPLAPSPEIAPPAPVVGTVPTVEAPDWWTGALNQLSAQMNRQDWPYLSKLEFGEVTADGVTLTYPTGSPIYLIQRYQRNIERAIRDTRFEATKVIFAERTKS